MLSCKYYLYKIILTVIFSFGVLLSGYAQKIVKGKDTLQLKTTTVSFIHQPIATPYGNTVSQSQLPYAISSISGDQLKSINTPMIGNMLYGKLSGLYLTPNGSAPGNNDNPGLAIRGKQTFQDNGVMVLVDGFETNWQNLLPDEIASITVLKDAGALALYGLDAANGVVLITTKKGNPSSKTTIDFSSRVGIQMATVLPDFLGNDDYANLYNVAMVSDRKLISNGLFKDPNLINYYTNGTYPYLFPNTNWYNEVLKPSTLSQDYAINFKGGSEDAKYFVALGYANYEGLYGNTDKSGSINTNYNLKRYNVRANFDVNITNFLSAEIKFRGTMMDKKFPNASESTLWKTMAVFNPYPVKTEDGSWGGTQGYNDNPVASILQKGYQSINDRTVDANVKIIGKLDFITPGLTAYGQVVFSNFYYDTYNKTRGFAYNELLYRPDLATAANPVPYDILPKGATDKNFVISQGSGNQFNRTSILAGTEYNKTIKKGDLYASATYLQEMYRADGSEMPYAKQSVMGRVRYNWKQKYQGELGFALSGSENFPKANRFGLFPSLSAGWIISKEQFLENIKDISFFKIRASAGLLGNDRSGNSGRFIFNQYYNGIGTYFIGNTLGINATMYNQGSLANPNATWEKAFRYNVGFDIILWNTLTLTADYFREQRKDIFVPASNFLPALMGVNAVNVNRGETQNNGAEMQLTWRETKKSFGYFFSGNLSYAKNKIVNIEETPKPYPYLYAKGNPINQPFMLTAIGFFKDKAEIDNSPRQLFGEVLPGDIKYFDQNGDGFIDDNDRTPIGNSSLPNLYYGFEAGMNIKNVDFSFLIQGASMRSISLLDNGNIIPFLNGGVKPTQWVKDNYWTPEKGNSALFPRLTTETNNNNYRPSTLWTRDGSFLRLRNVEIGYTLPETLLHKMRFSKLRFYINGNNLITWDKINEIQADPEIFNPFIHPTLKSYNVGILLGL
jgi:TonB-linked SusC/RagA family outer membrane protein